MKARYWIAGCVALAVWLPLAAAAEEAFTVRDTDVFAGPSSEYPPIGQLPVNAAVELFGCLSDWSWCDVGFGPNRGWIYAGDIVVPYDNQRVAIIEYGPRIHVPLVTFSLTAYWDEHYRSRPWYGERQQWVSRVHIDANRGGPPPAGHERAASVAPAAQQPKPTRAAPAQAARQTERNAQPSETRQAQAAPASKQAQQQAQQQQQTRQAQAAPTSKQAQQQAQQQQTRRTQVAQSPKPEQVQQQAKAPPTERQASTRMAQGERQAQQPQRAQQAPKPEAAPKAPAKEEKPKEEH
ncbi:MAG TPA: SH3 domain-containing protein [Casimicrobiaceae bacterium]|jgi:uncharacterized protein YraI|nr:SH3 domain-containing protein [Casimicrobiaceae bacterium]